MKEKIINAYGYDGCIELRNDVGVRVILCPSAGGRILEYSYKGKNALYVDEEQNGWRYKPGEKRWIPVVAVLTSGRSV